MSTDDNSETQGDYSVDKDPNGMAIFAEYKKQA